MLHHLPSRLKRWEQQNRNKARTFRIYQTTKWQYSCSNVYKVIQKQLLVLFSGRNMLFGWHPHWAAIGRELFLLPFSITQLTHPQPPGPEPQQCWSCTIPCTLHQPPHGSECCFTLRSCQLRAPPSPSQLVWILRHHHLGLQEAQHIWPTFSFKMVCMTFGVLVHYYNVQNLVGMCSVWCVIASRQREDGNLLGNTAPHSHLVMFASGFCY